MPILGINASQDRASLCAITKNNKCTAIVANSCSFPAEYINNLKNSRDSWDCLVTTHDSLNVVKQAMPKRTRIETVDYCEALSMATICSTNWTSCAILLSDSEHTRLGYYANNNFYWIKSFTYPNSIALFSAAVTRFLGFDAIYGEDHARELSMRGTSIYADWIYENAVSTSNGSYNILHNLEQGIGVATASADVAASAQLVFSAVLTNLAKWLRRHVDIPRLAIVGRSAANYITNSAIANLDEYEQIAAISVTGAASTALGAAALLRRPLLEHHYIGIEQPSIHTAEQIAAQLLRGNIVQYNSTAEFSDNSFINNNKLMLPFEPLLHNIKNSIMYVVCQDTDYHSYFTGKHMPYFGQYVSTVNNKQLTLYKQARVITVGKNKNPLINRVLEITRAQGYPIIVSIP
jgi:predicted NodU family carbamoyl transferase